MAPWLFAFAGAKFHNYTVHWTRWLVDHAYGTTPQNGLPGNDDFGTLSAWACWAMVGFYPLAGTSRFALGAPRFDSIRIRRDRGDLCVVALGAGQPYSTRVLRCELNGRVLAEPFFDWADLSTSTELAGRSASGCVDKLEFWMGEGPGGWG